MCIDCGNINHFNNDWFQKALENKKAELENKPQGIVAETYERQFKSNFDKIIGQGFENIITNIKSNEL